MRRLSWFALPIAMLTLLVVSLTTNAGIPSENEEKAKVEEREWGKAVNGCQVSIQVEDYGEEAYGSVTLSIIVRNAGDGNMRYEERTLQTLDGFVKIVPEKAGTVKGVTIKRVFALTVKDGMKDEAPLTKYGEQYREASNSKLTTWRKLAPGERNEYSLVANRIYDMTLPGAYTITAAIQIEYGSDLMMIPVTSNTITVKVP